MRLTAQRQCLSLVLHAHVPSQTSLYLGSTSETDAMHAKTPFQHLSSAYPKRTF
jgi:hypothetical protein